MVIKMKQPPQTTTADIRIRTLLMVVSEQKSCSREGTYHKNQWTTFDWQKNSWKVFPVCTPAYASPLSREARVMQTQN